MVMKTRTCTLLLVVATWTLATANDVNLQRIHRLYEMRDTLQQGDAPAKWFQQKLDHFRPCIQPSKCSFAQRYFVNDTFFDASHGPIFVYIGGEGALSASAVARGEIVELAQAHNGLVVALEHRYYGLSHPFEELTTENLEFLSSQQALADLINFREFLAATYKISANRFVAVGGSYPGNLAAWVRLKYPHAFEASLASSAPVFAKADFFEYDQVVSKSAGVQCAQDLRNATQTVEAMLSAGSRAEVKAMFGCADIEDDVAFLYVITDMAAYAIQYKDSVGDELCGPLEAASDKLRAYANYSQWLLNSFLHTDARTFDISHFTNTSWTEGENMRQWMYQSCNEFGYFQTAPKNNPLRSSRIDLAWHYGVCATLFGEKLIPDTDWTNAYYGSNHTAATKVFFTNGSLDPWTALGVRSSLSTEEPAVVINGTAHCADLRPSSPLDLPALSEARTAIRETLNQWIE